MKRYRQLFKHDPQNGVWGDCLRTAIGCVLDMPPEQVPHFVDGGVEAAESNRRVQEFLAPMGLVMVDFAYADDPQNVRDTMERLNPGVVYLLCARSSRGFNHAVVCRGGEVVCDPACDEGHSIVSACDDGYTWVSVIAKASP